MTQVFYAFGLQTPDATLTQLRGTMATYALRRLLLLASGDFAPSFAGAVEAAPTLTFASSDLRTLLTLFDAQEVHGNGRDVSYDGAAGNSDLFFQQGEAFGNRIDLATATHERLRYTQAFMVWNTITAAQGAIAEMAVALHPVHDGVNDPLVQAQAAIGFTPAINSVYTLGPISINGTLYDGLQRMTWNNQLALNLIRANGSPFLRHASWRSYTPIIRATVRNAALHRSVTSRGLAITSYSQYLRREKVAQIAYDDGDLQHIKFAGSKGVVHGERLDANGLVELTVALTRPTSTTPPFTMAYDQAIT